VTVLCLVELDGSGAAEPSLRALTFARRLAGPVGESVAAVAFGPAGEPRTGAASASGAGPESLAGVVSAFGAADLYAVAADGLDGYAPAAWARALAGLATDLGASAVIAAGTDHGAEVLAHLGAITGLPMAANCASASRHADGSYELVRHRWAGSLLEDAVLTASPALLTVAVDAVVPEPVRPDQRDDFPADSAGNSSRKPEPAAEAVAVAAAVHELRADLDAADLLVVARESAERSAGVSLASARVVVGGGRGVGGPEGFGPLEDLAGLLGGVVGVSRVVTSQGWRPHKQQVGQTGTRISPELYLACGISGAIQHMAGCLSAKHIIAVNTDPDAPIISHADYAVIGDLNLVIPALIAALRARSGAS
jgi:electron transfer flavoprotein alpha subunit